MTKDDIETVAQSVRALSIGANHCRYCSARSPHWEHDKHCAYVQSVKDCQQANEILSREKAEP